MGCVYRAEHTAIRRPLAIKLLHPEVEGIDGVTARFQREAFAIGRVDHPNCVNVSDFGRLEDGTFYMVLEVLDGVALFELLEKERRLDWRRALHIARHVLSALGHAHDRGIVHRDVKPENVILVEQSGDPDFAKILDFGIAKLFDDAQAEAGSPTLTRLGVTIGTPTYIAPEQAFGQPVDARADLYSLSVMLFEMITGLPPFDSDEVLALLTMHATAAVPRFADVAPDLRVPPEVEAMIRQGLEKKRDDRIQSAPDYIAHIDRLLARQSLREFDASRPDDTESRLSWVEGVRAGARAARKTMAPVVDRAVSGMRGLPKPRSKRTLFATSVVVVAVMSVGLLLLGNHGPDYLPTRTRLPLVPAKHGPEAETAATMLEQGQPNEATAYLRSQGSKVKQAPYAQLVLGHAHATAQRNVEALRAYDRAIKLEPTLSKDKLLRTNLNLMLQKSDLKVVEAALDLLGTLVTEVNDKRAAQELVRIASSSSNLPTRQRARQVADRVDLGSQIDRLTSYTLDLRQGRSCADRRDAVAKLRALGDKRAIPELRTAMKRTRVEGLLRRRSNANACLKTDAEEAIRYLNSI